MILEQAASMTYASFVMTVELLLLIWNYKLIRRWEITQVSLNVLALLFIWTTIVIRNFTASQYAKRIGEPVFSIDDYHYWIEIFVRGSIRIPFYIGGVLLLVAIQRMLADYSQCGKGIYWLCWFGLASFGAWLVLVLTGNGTFV